MRDILFRAKRFDAGGAWTEGYFVSSGNGTNEIIPKDSCWNYAEGFSPEYEVDPDTLGQYTGLNDRNGKRIFEGDIVRYHDSYIPVDIIFKVVYEEAGFFVCGDKTAPLFRSALLAIIAVKLQVIGNIHDNPELIGSENGDRI